MKDWFAGSVAETYDDDAEMFAPEAIDPVVELLAPLAEGGALELAIGTGRIAIPLAARGIRVAGIELSPDMLAQLRRKGSDIAVTLGDMTTTHVDGTFSLVYLVFNTIMNLTTQEAQVECFRNASSHLGPGGRFVVETMIPELRRLPPGATRVGIDEYDVVTQRLVSHHEEVSVPFRYVWPSELDLMARLAGMELESRWGGWRREPFTAESTSHVSVWRKIA